jgi:hypothetical protein
MYLKIYLDSLLIQGNRGNFDIVQKVEKKIKQEIKSNFPLRLKGGTQ